LGLLRKPVDHSSQVPRGRYCDTSFVNTFDARSELFVEQALLDG
jgi:hypothetical protein